MLRQFETHRAGERRPRLSSSSELLFENVVSPLGKSDAAIHSIPLPETAQYGIV
jgi:hypothetical protein